jgi:hypothetical protein
MKTKYLIYTLLALSFFLSSCREISVKTTVNEDGSFTRLITLRGDSSEVVKLDLPYPVDSSWLREIHRDTSDSSVFICTHTKTYNNDDALNKDIQNDTSWRKQIKRDVSISKRFMFFYSFITYRQVYKAANSLSLNYKEYISQEDLLWLNDEKTATNKKDSLCADSADARLEKYFGNALVPEIIHALDEGLRKLNIPQLADIDLTIFRDSIAANALSWTSGSFENSIDALEVWTGKPEVSQLHDIKPSIFENLEQKNEFFDKLIFEESYNLEIQMPGLITKTNSTRMLGNTVIWKIEPFTFFFEDYEMSVESRVINYWAFVLSGIIILLLLIATIIKIFK